MKSAKPKKSSMIYYLVLIGFFGIFSTTISKNPVLPLFSSALNASEFIVGLIAAVSPLAGILFSFPIGYLSDKIGFKKLLILSGFVFLSAPLLYLFVNSALWLIPIRFFHGIATAILGPVSASMIVSVYSKNKGEKLGFYSSSTLIGRTLAPLIGGIILSMNYFGNLWDYKLVYIAAFILAIPVFVLTLLLKPFKANKLNNLDFDDFTSSLKYIFINKKIFSTALVDLITYFAFGAFETYLPLYLTLKGIPGYAIGFVFSVQIFSIAFSKPLFGKIADKIDKRIQIIIGLFILGLSFGILGLVSNIILITVIGVIFGLGLSFSTIATPTYLSEIADKSRIGTTLGGLSSIMDVGHSLGPFITGIIISYFSYELGFFASFILSIIGIVLFLFCNYDFLKKD
ncbi:MAG: MFS transporter [Candidatus Nanoarchaeia archaeon]|jgi:MFS family permease